MSADTRLALVVLKLIHAGLSRTGVGFGKYPLGLRDAIEVLLPLVPADDPARPAIERDWSVFLGKLS